MSIISHYLFRLFWALSNQSHYFQNLFRLLRFFTSHSTKRSSGIFGEALQDYYSKKIKSEFIVYQHCLKKEYNGKKLEFDLDIYFRKWDDLLSIERTLISLSYGKILDIGSSTGYYILYLMEKETTEGIEI
ncbi:hypothetical protein LCGC14_1091910 [marine sediment metagenome]|uniref:Uncharacterized protein n=1 Tax=marine sediment metagenome TaxID=412755 RepID=A0A0F9MZU3_9ZZZZ|nr:MAG: hypothetical protein Lokiarch_20410 [Candidatus Lokiarchaeum sp. GC14_75]